MPVGARVSDLVDGVEGLLNGGEADGGGPEGGDEAECDLASGGCGGGLVEGFEDGAEGLAGDYEDEVVEELVVDGGGGACGKAEDGGRADEGREEGEEEVEAKFGGAAEEVVGEKGLPGAVGDGAPRDTLEIPEGAEGRAGDVLPYGGVGGGLDGGGDGGCPIGFF